MENFPPCPRCGAPMRKRTGPRGDFLSCTKWRPNDPNACRGTLDMSRLTGSAEPRPGAPGASAPRGYHGPKVPETAPDRETAKVRTHAALARLDAGQKGSVTGILTAQPDSVGVIAACAGSGKTTLLTTAYAALVEAGVPPRMIVMTTFTRKAANELRDRVGPLLPPGSFTDARVGTMHALAMRVVKRIFPSRFPNGRLLDSRERDVDLPSDREIWKAILQWQGPDRSKPRDPLTGRHPALPPTIVPGTKLPGLGLLDNPDRPDIPSDMKLSDWSGYIDNQIRAFTFENPDDPAVLAHVKSRAETGEIPPPSWREAWQLYVAAKKGLGAYDFADILAAWLAALERGPVDSASHVLVDEAQDNNLVQLRIAQLLAKHGRGRLFIIGDGRQAIYGWRGASPEFFTEAPIRLGASVFPMVNNYRSGSQIVEAGNILVEGQDYTLGTVAKAARDGGAFTGVVRLLSAPDEGEECGKVADEIATALAQDKSATPSDFAVLARNAATLGRYQVALILAEIPCCIVASRAKPFFARTEVRAVVAWWTLTERFSPEEWGRVFNEPRRGLSPDWGSTVADNMVGKGVEALPGAIRAAVGLASHRGRESAERLADAFEELLQAKRISADACGDRILRMWLPNSGVGATEKDWEDYLEAAEADEHTADRVQSMQVTVGIGKRFGSGMRLSAFAARCRDETPEVGADDVLPAGRVVLSTVHASKGLEWKTVYVSFTKGVFPSARATTAARDAEERRLAYVAVTRARDQLVLASSETLAMKPAGLSAYGEEIARGLGIGIYRTTGSSNGADADMPGEEEEGSKYVPVPWDMVVAEVEEIADRHDADANPDPIGVEDVTLEDVEDLLDCLSDYRQHAAEEGPGDFRFQTDDGKLVRIQFPFLPDEECTGYTPAPILCEISTRTGPTKAHKIPRWMRWRSAIAQVLAQSQ